ncbi:Uncharacterised protein [BD1-7 clade bacterium]|uniref:YhdP central domain-containing protein n=1 Tax=BD1-7 clade bacterium TaxID=2029982 RepID=A0A5S9MSN6_9GAMM|nr:Uncharacterised protein [BD1-7 clade bacterium]
MRIWTRLLNLLSQAVIAAFMLVVLVSAVLSSLFSYYLPRIDDYRAEVLETINHYTGDITINAEHISGSWQPFKPALQLGGVEVRRGDWEAPLTLSSVDVELDLIKTLAKRAWYFSNMSVSRFGLSLAQTDDGGWSLSAISQDQTTQPVNLKNLVTRAWNIGRLELGSLNLVLHPNHTAPIELPALAFEFTDKGGSHRLIASLKRDEKVITRLLLDAYGQPYTKNFRSKAYLEVEDLPLADVTTFAKNLGALDKGLFKSRLWLDWAADDFTVQGQVQLTNATVLIGDEPENQKPLMLKEVRADMRFEYLDGNLQAWFPDVYLENEVGQLDLDGLYLAKDEHLNLKLRTLDISQLFSFLQGLPVSDKMRDRLNLLAPQGKLSGTHVRFTPEDKSAGKPWDVDYATKLLDVDVNPWRSVPKLRNVNGVVFGQKFGGRVEFDTENLVMAFPQIYTTEMQFDRARGVIGWQYDKDWINIGGSQIDVDGKYGDVKGEFHVMLPVNEEIKLREPARLSLDLGIRNSDAKYRQEFIPQKKIDPKLMAWLNDNIHSGKISQGGFIYNGPVSKPKGKNPLDEDVTMQLWLDIQQASLTYLPGWPDVSGVDTELLMDDLAVTANIDRAETAGMRLHNATFNLTPIGPDGTKNRDQAIRIRGQAEATSTQVVDFLTLPAMPETTRELLKSWKISGGDVNAWLDINTRLKRPTENLDVKVESQVAGVDIDIPEANIKASNIRGKLDFDLKRGISSPQLKATFLGQPVMAKIQATGSPGAFSSLMTFDTALSVDDLNRWNHQPINALLSGKTQFNGEISFGGDNPYVKIISDMEGVAVDLPAPLAKAADEPRELVMTLPLSFSNDRRELVFSYGKSADIRFLLTPKGLRAGQINLGVNKVGYETGAISVGGQLSHADVEQWLRVFGKYTEAEKDLLKAPVEQNASGNSLIKETSNWHVNVDKLKIRRIDAYGQTVFNSVVSIFNTTDYWQILLEHAQFDGILRVYNDPSLPMNLDINTVDIGLLMSDKTAGTIAVEKSASTKFPDLNVNVDKLYWNGDDFGSWRFNVRTTDKAIMLKDVFGSFKSMRLTSISEDKPAQATWNIDGSGTYIQGRFSGVNLANTLQMLSYQEEITSESFKFDTEIYWPGSPQNFSIKTLRGFTNVLMKNGSFNNIDSSSASALKVLGILNINLLLKRLQLDFSDLTAKGLAYDEVKGRIDFDDGLFDIDKPLVVKSPSSKISLNGWADLNNQTIDMTLGATLPLASNIPWLVALAGGLPTAAGVYVISRLLKKQVDALSSAVYSVTGDLQDPTIKFEKLFDTGSRRSRSRDLDAGEEDPFPYE